MKMSNKTLTATEYLVITVLAIIPCSVLAVLSFILIYLLAVSIDPPYYTDAVSGERHTTMVLGQVFIAFMVSSLFTLAAFVFTFRFLRNRKIKSKMCAGE